MILRPCILQWFTSDPRGSGKPKPTCRPLIKTRQRTALEEMNNISRLKRKITQNAIRRTAVPHALQRTHFALRAEKRAKRKRKRNPYRFIADEKLAGVDLSAASQPVSKSLEKAPKQVKRKNGLKRKITQNAIRRTAVPHALQRTHFALRAEKRAKRKRKRNPDRFIADEKLAGVDPSAASQPVSKSLEKAPKQVKRKNGLKRKITQNAIRRTAVPHALQRTHFALRAEKRAKRKRKRNPYRFIADEKLAGIDLSAASQPVSKSLEKLPNKPTDSTTRNAFLSASFISSMIIFCDSDSLGKGV